MNADLTAAARQLKTAREQLAVATDNARQAAIAAAADGTPETVIATQLGVDRARTLRRWLGK